MAEKETMQEKIKKLVGNTDRIRNIGIAAHIDHGKTTLSDNLLSGAGMLSEALAGKALKTDFDAQEQERGITIYSANVSMVHEYSGDKYLINLIDTPGHVDFGGDVTRAMRAVDGAVVLACAVEGVMPQTETVLRQALKERVKPILFINKTDRLIKELQLTQEQMQERFAKIIGEVNSLISKYAPDQYKKEWLVDVKSGKVAFGSAYHNWAISIPYMQKTGITFKDIAELTKNDKIEELAHKAPLHVIVLDMVIKHLPTPKEAQVYRTPRLWTGETETEEGKSMLNCDASGPLVGVVTNVNSDPHAGLVSTVRLFSGTIKDGQDIYLVGQNKSERAQQVAVFDGPKRVAMQSMPCGNIIAITGITSASSGETICNLDRIVAPFESIKHVFEPVVTKSLEVKNVQQLPKLIELLKQRSREDPTIKINISEDTGETLVSGLGELHIEAKIERFLHDRHIDISVSKPIVIYKESVQKESRQFEGKSPNKHNKFYIKVDVLPKEITDVLLSGELREGKVRKKDKEEITKALVERGIDKNEAKKVIMIHKGNMFLDLTRGVVQLHEVIELVMQSFQEICEKGPLAEEPAIGLKVMLKDAKLHEDAIHRGPAQVLPAVKGAIKNGMVDAGAILLEPKQILRIDSPTENMGNVMTEVQNRRGQVLDMRDEAGMTIFRIKLPVAEMTGFEASLKSATGGRGFQSLVDITFEKLPHELQTRTALAIRKRKGLKEELPRIVSEE